ncbi:Hypothetical predicted protein [Podarcis lilfordi]|uniref:Uncharacterized protein n=1 Tax=Podarcis lilfordi TaxID=74358 RepID=A0AA35P046_9SAUR|nr:Hypothetical predicted protein [Podarcis lilfordi]
MRKKYEEDDDDDDKNLVEPHLRARSAFPPFIPGAGRADNAHSSSTANQAAPTCSAWGGGGAEPAPAASTPPPRLELPPEDRFRASGLATPSFRRRNPTALPFAPPPPRPGGRYPEAAGMRALSMVFARFVMFYCVAGIRWPRDPEQLEKEAAASCWNGGGDGSRSDWAAREPIGFRDQRPLRGSVLRRAGGGEGEGQIRGASLLPPPLLAPGKEPSTEKKAGFVCPKTKQNWAAAFLPGAGESPSLLRPPRFPCLPSSPRIPLHVKRSPLLLRRKGRSAGGGRRAGCDLHGVVLES